MRSEITVFLWMSNTELILPLFFLLLFLSFFKDGVNHFKIKYLQLLCGSSSSRFCLWWNAALSIFTNWIGDNVNYFRKKSASLLCFQFSLEKTFKQLMLLLWCSFCRESNKKHIQCLFVLWMEALLDLWDDIKYSLC